MKFVKAPVLFAFSAVLVSFTAMASPGDSNSAGGNTINTITTAPQDKNDKWQHREVKAAEKSAHQDLYANYINFLALIAALIAIIISFKTARDNKKYNKSQTRAYVGLDNIEISNISSDEVVYANCTVINTGRTPAHNVNLRANIYRDAIKKEFTPPFQNLTLHSNFVIWPNQQIYKSVSFNSAKLNPLFKHGTYFVYGIIEYDDIYGERHETKFCRKSTPEIVRNGSGSLIFTKYYNTAN